jgi:hypothetical protein
MLEKRPPNFSFLDQNPVAVGILFHLVDFLRLDELQNTHLEPFNEKISKHSIS